MGTSAYLKDDETVVEILRDGSERPLALQGHWSRIDTTTEAEIAAGRCGGDARCGCLPTPRPP
jgi:hypothetical protein